MAEIGSRSVSTQTDITGKICAIQTSMTNVNNGMCENIYVGDHNEMGGSWINNQKGNNVDSITNSETMKAKIKEIIICTLRELNIMNINEQEGNRVRDSSIVSREGKPMAPKSKANVTNTMKDRTHISESSSSDTDENEVLSPGCHIDSVGRNNNLKTKKLATGEDRASQPKNLRGRKPKKK